MITKKEFKEFKIEEQVNLVNQELKEAKGTKNFGKYNLDFSYGFARTILTNNGYETLDETSIDGIKIKLFRKMSDDELKEKENKELEKNEKKIEEKIALNPINNINKNDLHIVISNDIYLKNLEITNDKKTISKNFPIFEDTYEEFKQLLTSDEFKLYEKKYIIELMFRTFLDKYHIKK